MLHEESTWRPRCSQSEKRTKLAKLSLYTALVAARGIMEKSAVEKLIKSNSESIKLALNDGATSQAWANYKLVLVGNELLVLFTV